MRLFQLAIGVFIAMDGFSRSDWFIAAFGGFFMAAPLLNIGCFSSRGCNTMPSQKVEETTEDIIYEEVE